MRAYAERNVKKYTVTITVNFENGCFFVPVEAETEEQAQEFAVNKLCNEYPIYRDCTTVYNVREA